jgi:hypothetical protein
MQAFSAMLRDTIKETPYTLDSIRKVQRQSLHEAVENAGKNTTENFSYVFLGELLSSSPVIKLVTTAP